MTEKELGSKIRQMRHEALTDFNDRWRGKPGDGKAEAKAALVASLDRLEAFLRAQPLDGKPDPRARHRGFWYP